MLLPSYLHKAIEGWSIEKGTTVEGVVVVALKSFFSGEETEYPRLFKNRSVLDDALREEKIIETKEQLVDYLLKLRREAYHDCAVGTGVIHGIADLSLPFGSLSVRFSIDLLRTCGEIAEAMGSEKINFKHVWIAYHYLYGQTETLISTKSLCIQ